MSAVHFTVPDELKNAFNATFAEQDKNTMITDLMREAVERAKYRKQRHEAIRRILDRRSRALVRSESEIAAVRREGRP